MSPLPVIVDCGLTSSSGARVLMQMMATPIKFRSMVLIEPMLIVRPGDDYERLRSSLVRFALKRKDVWDNRKEAAAYFRTVTRWNPRMVDMFVVSIP